jgi:peptide deformylase
MALLELILAPDPIYKTVCTPVAAVDDAVRATLGDMVETLHAYHAMGIGAPMVGITQRLVVIALEDETGAMHEYQMVNPVVTKRSPDVSTMEEASITFPGISAPVTRPAAVTVEYLDADGAKQVVHAMGILAVCLQHEIDYLDGKTFLDYQPPVKRDMLRRKMEKQKRTGPLPHVHGAHCNH